MKALSWHLCGEREESYEKFRIAVLVKIQTKAEGSMVL
jgi:hypothetical protein